MPVINGISKIYRGDFMLVTHHYQFSKRMEMHDITATVKKMFNNLKYKKV